MSTTALPGLTPGRQPYPGGAERHVPIVPHVLIIGERKGYYLPPPIIRAETVYDTPTTVRVRLPQGRQETQQQHKVWAVPDDAAWREVEAAVGAFGQRLAELANVLRELGRYADRLAAWKGAKTAPNPLCPTVARIDDPDTTGTNWWLSAWHVPRLDRRPVVRHTPKMLTGDTADNAYFFQQAGSFVLADDADWELVEAAHQAAEQAARDAQALLERLGTYQDALDGRHAARVAPAERAVGSPAPSAAAAVREHLAHALGWTGPGTPTYHLERARAELELFRAEAPGLALELERELAAAAAQVAAREAGEKALAVISPAVDGIVVMTVEEARQAADAIKVAVEDLRVKIDEFDQGQGWKALGYDSFRAWAAAEIPDTSLRHVYRLRDAAEVDRSLGAPVGSTPESHARELKSVPAEQRAEVLQKADERAQGAGRERTAADVRAAATSWLPDGWDEARDRARAVGARLWYNDSDGTYTLSERAGHVPRTSSWSEALMWLRAAEQRAAAPPPADPAAEVEALIADLGVVEARLEAGGAGADDRAALHRIAERADALGALALGTRAGELLQALPATEAPARAPRPGTDPAPALPAGWSWRPRGDSSLQAWDGTIAHMTACYPPDQQAEAAADAWRRASTTPPAEPAAPPAAPSTGDAMPASEPPPPPPAFDARVWSRRATVAGAKLLIYAHDYQLVERDGTRRRYADHETPALVERIGALLEAALAPHAPPAARPIIPRRPRPAARSDHSEVMRELGELRRWADQVEQILAVLTGAAPAAPVGEAQLDDEEEPDPADDELLPFELIGPELDDLEARLAAGDDRATMRERLTRVDEHLALLAGDDLIPLADYEAAQRRAGGLRRRLDEEEAS